MAPSNPPAVTTTTLKRKRPSAQPALSRPKPTKPRPTAKNSKSRAVECPICLEPTKPKQLITLDTCGCKYCKSCLQEAFTVGLTNTTYPARCCGRPLELTTVEKHVGAKIARAYRRKGEEVTANLPLYCANSACGGFVGEGIDNQPITVGEDGHHGEDEQAQEKFLTCGKCHMKTCRFKECKKLYKAHLGVHAMCPDDVEDEGVRKLRRKKGWKRCPRCWALTEKTRGCDGIRYVAVG